MYTMNTPKVRQAVEWLAKDATQRRPKLATTIFDKEELNQAAKLELDADQAEELMLHLERVHWVVRTNKMGAHGYYYNVAPTVFRSLHPGKDTNEWVQKLRILNDGYCVVHTKSRIYRQSCEAKKCRFYLDSQNRCIRDKFFLK